MRSGSIGLVLGVVLTLLALAVLRHLAIEAAADDLNYRFSQYVFSESEFPSGDLDQGRVVRRCLFPVRITTTFYNAQYQKVTQAEKPGRYGAVVRIGLDGSIVLHRYVTLYRTPAKVFWYETPMPVLAQLPPEIGLDRTVLRNQAAQIGEAIKNDFLVDGASPNLAILLAGLSETSPDDPPAVERTNSIARDAAWWYGLRERLGLAEKYRYLIDLPRGYDAHPGQRWPLILYLHGGAEKGNDLRLVRESGLAKRIAGGGELPAIVISPQCSWYEYWSMPGLSQLLDDVSARYRVDPDRVYLTGASMGGDATWDLALAHPELFAALVPIAGESDPADAARIKDIPTWAFQGEADHTVPPKGIIDMVNAIRRAGGHPHLTLFPGVGHDSWDKAYATDALYTWLFAQKRAQPEVVTPGLQAP
jgi:pimeloyl-ACP methyl ester carboxylesterase